LDQRERLEDGVVQVRGNLGAFFVPDVSPSFLRELLTQAIDPWSEDQAHSADCHYDGEQDPHHSLESERHVDGKHGTDPDED
jgi:hypothetical protein